MQKYYKLEMNRTLKITTGLVWTALIALPAAMTALRYFATSRACAHCSQPAFVPQTWMITATTLTVGCIIYFTLALAPRGFALNDIELVIDRALYPVKIPLTAITEARRLEDAEMRRTLRLMGASGFYAHYGWFWNKKLGRFRFFSGRFDDLVLVRSGAMLFVLGPEDPAGFTTALRSLTHL